MGDDITYTVATGDSNGQIKVTPSSGSAYNVSVKGLGSAAYTASTAYDAAGAASGVQSNLNSHTGNKSNPHGVTSAQVGAVAKIGDVMTGRLQLNMSNPHIHMKDTGYSTDWYFQAHQDQLAFGPTFDTAVKTDKTGNMTVPGTVTVENKVKLDYDSTNECLNFVFV
mgnify:CR=1 FL=1